MLPPAARAHIDVTRTALSTRVPLYVEPHIHLDAQLSTTSTSIDHECCTTQGIRPSPSLLFATARESRITSTSNQHLLSCSARNGSKLTPLCVDVGRSRFIYVRHPFVARFSRPDEGRRSQERKPSRPRDLTRRGDGDACGYRAGWTAPLYSSPVISVTPSMLLLLTVGRC